MGKVEILRDKNRNGKKAGQGTAAGQQHAPNLSKWYNRTIAPLRPGEFNFHVLLIRPEQKKKDRILPLGEALSNLDWDDSGQTMTASVELQRPDVEEVGSLPVRRAHTMRLTFDWTKKPYRLWDLRVQDEPTIDVQQGTLSVNLEDDLAPLDKNQRDWEYRSSKKHHPKGWTCDQVARDAAKKEGVRISKLVKGTKDVSPLTKKSTSALEVIRAAYAEEAKSSGRVFYLRLRRGKLEILEYKRRKIAYVINNLITAGTLDSSPVNQHPVTVIEAHARIQGHHVTMNVFRTKPLRQFGRLVKKKDYGRLDSRAALRTKAKEDLVRELKVTRTATLTIPGVPFLERGDTVRWITKERGWFGRDPITKADRSYGFVKGASHSSAAGDYTTTLTLSQVDPFLLDQKARDQIQRQQKRRQHQSLDGGGQGGGGGGG